MFSLTGLPPLAGFWGKFALFTAALGVDAKNPEASSLWPWFLALAIVGAVNAAISAGYYLRIVAVMYFRPSLARPEGRGGSGARSRDGGCACWCWVSASIRAPGGSAATRASQAARPMRPQSTAAVHKSGPRHSTENLSAVPRDAR